MSNESWIQVSRNKWPNSTMFIGSIGILSPNHIRPWKLGPWKNYVHCIAPGFLRVQFVSWNVKEGNVTSIFKNDKIMGSEGLGFWPWAPTLHKWWGYNGECSCNEHRNKNWVWKWMGMQPTMMYTVIVNVFKNDSYPKICSTDESGVPKSESWEMDLMNRVQALG